MKDLKDILLLLAIILCSWIAIGVKSYYAGLGKWHSDIVTDSIHDTILITKIDTLPVVKNTKIVRYVPIKEVDTSLDCSEPTEQADSMLPIVQKEYSDDSTYTAYVSGIKYEDYPKLDSIEIRNRIIKETITKTITIQERKSRWGVSVSAGPTFDAVNGKIGAGVSLGLSYTIFNF